MPEKRTGPTILTPGAIQKLQSDRAARRPPRFVLHKDELYRDDLLVGQGVQIVKTTARSFTLRYTDTARPSSPSVVHTLPLALVKIRRTPPANARRPEPITG